MGCPPEAGAFLPSLLAALKLLILHAPVLFFGRAAARALRPGDEPLAMTVSSLLIYFLALTLPLGVSPGLSFKWLLIWAAAYGIAGALLSLRRPKDRQPERPGAMVAPGLMAALALMACALLVTGVFDPRFDHDPLTYQLYFAATWLRDGHVSIAPTPFGDPSQAYGPALASMYFLWLMAPLGNDMLAQAGQWPFLALAVLAACGLAREMGAGKGWEWTAGLFMLVCPLLVYEGRSAFSDLAAAGFFTCSLYFLVRAARAGRPCDLAFGLLSFGLAAGCKYTAAPLLILLLPVLLMAAFRVRKGALAAWLVGAASAVAGGGVWYIRNWLISGNPVFPIRVSLSGHEIFAGLYGREQMVNWVFHQEGAAAWWKIMLTNFPPLFLALAIIAIVDLIVVGLLRRGHSENNNGERSSGLLIAYVALVPILIDRLYWNVLPFQVDRFWLSAAPMLAAALGVACSRHWALAAAALGLSYAGLFLWPTSPELGRATTDWIKIFLPAGLALGTLSAWIFFKLVPARIKRTATAAAVLIAFVMIVTVAGLHHYESRRAGALASQKYGQGWLALPCPGNALTVAYTGANVPYPLLGPSLQNRVVYVSTAGQVMPKDHELFKAMRGEVPLFQTPEPMLSNLTLSMKQWADGIIASGADYLLVMRLGRNALLNIAHDPDGWPGEDSWARAAPKLFLPVYQDQFTRIYQVDRNAPVSLPDWSFTRPPDALAVCQSSSTQDQCQKFFPLAPMALRSMESMP